MTTNPNDLTNPFRVNTLTARGQYGSAPTAGLTYELTRQSVRPERVVGRDKLGRPITETVNVHYSQPWLHPSGTINSVVMRTGAIFSMEAAALAYEHETTVDLLTDGWIPLRCCPYTADFRRITGTPHLVHNPQGIPDCGGDEANGGCVHLKELASARTKAFLEEYRANEEAMTRMSKTQASELLDRMSQALAVAQEVADSDSDDEDAPPPRPRPRGK